MTLTHSVFPIEHSAAIFDAIKERQTTSREEKYLKAMKHTRRKNARARVKMMIALFMGSLFAIATLDAIAYLFTQLG